MVWCKPVVVATIRTYTL